MPTPKIKLYRLPLGYSSVNDNDIQSATNDQLLPVKLKNIMPSQAYTLVGVNQSEKQVLVPVIHLDQNFKDSKQDVGVEDLIHLVSNQSGTSYYIPDPSVTDGYADKFLVCNKSEMSPKFFVISTDLIPKRSYLNDNQCVYVQNINDYLSQINNSNESIKLVYGYDQAEKKWIVIPIDSNYDLSNIYVCNLYKYCLQQCVQNITVENVSYVYDLTRKYDCQDDSLFPVQFVPFVYKNSPKHLRPRIAYYSELLNNNDSDNSLSNSSIIGANNVQLTEDNKCLTVTEDYKIKSISSSIGNLDINDVYGKHATLVYYTIPKNKQQIIEINGETVYESNQNSYSINEINNIDAIYYDRLNVYRLNNKNYSLIMIIIRELLMVKLSYILPMMKN